MNGVENVFPKDFSWGAMLDAHQTEGDDFNSDWWRWEQRPGRIAENVTSEKAVQHLTPFMFVPMTITTIVNAASPYLACFFKHKLISPTLFSPIALCLATVTATA